MLLPVPLPVTDDEREAAELALYHHNCRYCGDPLSDPSTRPSSCRDCASPDRLEECE